MSRYLITGGAGFIGSHLADALINKGHQVTILDDLSSGKEKNINSACRFIKGNVSDQGAVKKAFEEVDFCYHMAAIASVQKSVSHWLDSHNVNLTGTINIFLEAATRNVPVVYASSAAIYGDPEDLPIAENSLVNPTSPYGLDKYACELQAKLFAKIHNLKTIGLRFFNVYGTRQDPHSPYSGVISIFLERITNNQPLNVYGDGSQERDFVFIEDVINILVKAEGFVSLEAKTYNVCTGEGVSINKLIEVLFTALNKKVPINYLPVRKGDIYKSIGKNQKIFAEMNYKVQNKVGPDIFIKAFSI